MIIDSVFSFRNNGFVVQRWKFFFVDNLKIVIHRFQQTKLFTTNLEPTNEGNKKNCHKNKKSSRTSKLFVHFASHSCISMNLMRWNIFFCRKLSALALSWATTRNEKDFFLYFSIPQLDWVGRIKFKSEQDQNSAAAICSSFSKIQIEKINANIKHENSAEHKNFRINNLFYVFSRSHAEKLYFMDFFLICRCSLHFHCEFIRVCCSPELLLLLMPSKTAHTQNNNKRGLPS